MIVVGGVMLIEDDASAIFAPGTVISDAAAKLLENLNQRLGYAQTSAAEQEKN